MSPAQLKTTATQVIKRVASKSNIQVYNNRDLREARRIKQLTASLNPGWTLYINKKGSLCHAVHRTGPLLLLEAPDYYHDCFSTVHATNYFVNTIRSVSRGV